MISQIMKKNKENGVQMPWNEPEFVEMWQEWLAFRREQKWTTYKPRGLKMTFENLVEISGNDYKVAIEIIKRSMRGPWMGLFPLPKNYNNGQPFKQPITTDGLKDAINKHIEGWK